MNKGTLVINGIDYSNGGGGSGGGSNVDCITLTKAEYDALPDTKLFDGKYYYISDWHEEGPSITELIDLKMLGWTVPKECPIQNYVDGNVYHQKVGRVDLGELTWSMHTSGNVCFRTVIDNLVTGKTKNSLFCLKYSTSSYVGRGTLNDKEICQNSSSSLSTTEVNIKDSSYNTETNAFKSAMQGVYLYYELATEITKTIDGNEKTTEIDNIYDSGFASRNLLVSTVSSQTINGVTFTVNADKSVTVNGTATNFIQFYLNDGVKYNGTFKLVGCPSGGTEETYLLGYRKNNVWTTPNDVGNGATVVVDGSAVIKPLIFVQKGVTANNLLFKPMLTYDLNATYDDYTPYAPSNLELQSEIETLEEYTSGGTVVGDATHITDNKITWEKVGKLVVVQGQFTSTTYNQGQSIMVTGLPKTRKETRVMAMNYNDNTMRRLYLEPDGGLYQWFSNLTAGQYIVNFSYIAE